MYDRRLEDGRVLRFGHAGILVQDSFVLYDHQTDSLWVHVTGTAYAGPLTGTRLRFLPSTVATWADWKAAHPDTTVLPGRRSEGFMEFMGRYEGLAAAGRLGLAVVVRGRAKLYPFSVLAEGPVRNDAVADLPVVVAYDGANGTATAWGRRAGGRLLTFAPAPARPEAPGVLLRDEQTGSLWQALSGQAVAGPLRGEELPALTAHPILIDRFRAFYPGAAVATGRAP